MTRVSLTPAPSEAGWPRKRLDDRAGRDSEEQLFAAFMGRSTWCRPASKQGRGKVR